ncbi:hypothetical protein BIW11_05243 [Tropilaelaps mercedesae]|uniref:Thyroglobulin type-1 domain-containing protein n=1 Tax=Tropilaelaps mercedesae TaxID=418985 RepID=A0A1V9Y343_9ACAR|nr:hypothetical protein BIW11_05243 [Tropilaelaps mercedesae]
MWFSGRWSQYGFPWEHSATANLIDYAALQCIGETCACVTHSGINITDWSSSIANCACPVIVREILDSARDLAIELPVCEHDGQFATMVCDENVCWSVDEHTGERKFHSRTHDEINSDIEGFEQRLVGRSARRKRSLSEDYGDDNNENDSLDDDPFNGAHKLSKVKVKQIDGTDDLFGSFAGSLDKLYPPGMKGFKSSASKAAKPCKDSGGESVVSSPRLPIKGRHRRRRPQPYMRPSLPMAGLQGEKDQGYHQ